MTQYYIPENGTLFSALCQLFPNSSKTALRTWLKEGRVSLDGKSVKIGSQEVRADQQLTISKKKLPLRGGIELLWRDPHLLVINKPQGLLSVSTPYETEETAHALLKEQMAPQKVEIVHRLDLHTSGVMVFACTKKTQQALKSLFQAHTIERRYVAIVEGVVSPRWGTWRSYLCEDENYYVYSTEYEEDGELAITHYRVNNSKNGYSRLDLQLETGKKNQIRVHCSEAGYPIAGDDKYGAQTDPVHRLALHAYLLAFRHPITGQPMRFSAPPPPSFSRLVPPAPREG